MNLKYGIWNVSTPKIDNVNALSAGGYAPLAAMVLSARGIGSPAQAAGYLGSNAPLEDPFSMTDMDKAVNRVGLALATGETIAVFGDYDVDGITATCLLTDFLRRMGGKVISYIPGRLEEGYGLNPIAISYLHDQGVSLIVTVDCGITAVAEAKLCRDLGMDLVITDHHVCKAELPQAVAVVDPHRPGDGYPHQNLSGVGVAFKLASAIWGSQDKALEAYADFVCLGTVADVMLLQGENRTFVSHGLDALAHTSRPGLAALMKEAGCDPAALSATSIGFVLAPRINAAGRMGKIQVAVDLFLSTDPVQAEKLAKELCQMNTQRQAIEQEIYRQAISMLPTDQTPKAIVLAEESWHQGVVGIVASRIAEEFCCPTVLICLDGEHGKASSRSYGGFNLFASLTELAPLLESYGGHELAAGFTIPRENIPKFRQELCRLAEHYYRDGTPQTTLQVDCAVEPELLTIPNIDALQVLEPCGNGCPKPVLMLTGLTLEHIQSVGNGRHLRLRLSRGRFVLNAIYFSVQQEGDSFREGDLVDVAFTPQVNEFRGSRSVQLNVVDVRPACPVECCQELCDYRAMRSGRLTAEGAERLLPDRKIQGAVWRYIAAEPSLKDTPCCLCRKIVRKYGVPVSLGQMLTCLDMFADVGLLALERQNKYILVRPLPVTQKADLTKSETMQLLLRVKEK